MNTITPIDPHTIVSPAKASELLAVRPTTLRKWRERNVGPVCHKFSAHSYFYPLLPLVQFHIQRILERKTA